MTMYHKMILLFVFLLTSCREEMIDINAASPPERQYPLPHQEVLELFEDHDLVQLMDRDTYEEPAIILQYLIPLLYEEGITEMIWTIIDDPLVFNELITAESYDEEAMVNALKDLNYRQLRRRNLNLLYYLWEFNSNIGTDSDAFLLASPGEDGIPRIVFGEEQLTPALPIWAVNPEHLPPSWNQIQSRLAQGERYFIVDKDESGSFYIVLKPLEEYSRSPMALEFISKDDIPRCLEDFPEISWQKPRFWALWRLKSILKKL